MDPRGSVRRLLLPFTIAITVAVGGSLAVFGSVPAGRGTPAGAPALAVSSPADQIAARNAVLRAEAFGSVAARQPAAPAPMVLPTPAGAVENAPVAQTRPTAEPTKPKPPKTQPPRPKPPKPAPVYRGRNHVWIPSLGVNRSVYFYSCSRSTALANVVYRWGCAGSNNVYLMGHAHSVFRALHNAYYSGRLRKGMEVIYADNSGRVTRYRVSFWKVVSPAGQSWAYASQSRPSLTLQTCVGRNSQYRLVVRLVKSG